MIDFDELDGLDTNLQLRHALENDNLADEFHKVIKRARSCTGHADYDDDDDDCSRFGANLGARDIFAEAAARPREPLLAEEVHIMPGRAIVTLVVLVPFRDDVAQQRGRQLHQFVRHFRREMLGKLAVTVKVMVLEQADAGGFNRGKLLNLGARWCRMALKGEVLLCAHDVDLLPERRLVPFYGHYQPGECLHLGWVNRKYNYEHFFGGVCSMPLVDFFRAGGFPNEFWGWGREDDVLHARLLVLAEVRVRVPGLESGMQHQDQSEPFGRSPRSESGNVILKEHLLGQDNIFDTTPFQLMDHAERDWLGHLLFDLQPSKSRGIAGSCGASEKAARLSEKLLDDLLAG